MLALSMSSAAIAFPGCEPESSSARPPAAGAGGQARGGAAGAGVSGAGGSGATGGNAVGGSGGGAVGGVGPSGGGSEPGGGAAGEGAGGAADDDLVPAQGALLGAFVGTGTWADFESLLGRRVPIVHRFFGWGDDWVTAAQGDLEDEKIPLITWEPWTNASVGTSLDDIIAGVHDDLLQARASAARDLGKKFFLRWGHEMNGNWYPWGGFQNGADADAALKYISAYRHIHDVFTAAGAANVLWVFCPNVDSVPGDEWNAWSSYYPGDAYVDWMAFDGYNWGGASWRPFSSIVGAIYASLAAKSKPIIIPETASAEEGGDKAAWIAEILPALQGSYPAIKAFVWFEIDKETDWRVESSPSARESFVAFANSPYMNP